MNLRDIGEFGFVDQLRKLTDRPSQQLIAGIGDDAAVFRASKDQLFLLTTDSFVEDVHFNLDYTSYHQLGHRLMAANLSDIAAMGGWPKYVVVSLAVPGHFTVDSLTQMYLGMKSLADKFDTRIVGGDTSSSHGKLFISLTVLGEVNQSDLALRSGAQVGDGIFVLGELGISRTGFEVLRSKQLSRSAYPASVNKHLCPTPRLQESRFLVRQFPIHSMIDISDGLSSEVVHICKRSCVGAEVLAAEMPIADETREVARYFGQDAFEWALNGGEDFELMFTADRSLADVLKKAVHERFGLRCSEIGRINEDAKCIELELQGGLRKPLVARGFDHFYKIEPSGG